MAINQQSPSPEERFATIISEMLSYPDVTPPSNSNTFGSSALKVQGKIFAMLVRGQLVVKLPRSRVDMLVASGDGERFTANRDRAMKEWLVLATTSDVEWLSLVKEALAFVGGASRS